MKPIVAIVGRPNVGKSTLFNRLTRAQSALVDDFPGVTRDRIYRDACWDGVEFTVVDTGGFSDDTADPLSDQVRFQLLQAMADADLILFVLDGKAGLSPFDAELLDLLRARNKPVFYAVNKIDGADKEDLLYEFHSLGLETIYPVSAAHGYGVPDLLDDMIARFPKSDPIPSPDILRAAVVGRPNVGKSSLINRILGEQRLVVSGEPGTTRDAVDTLFERNGRSYLFVDTAGIRKKGRVEKKIEKFSVIRALKSLERCDIALLVMDAVDGLTDQDLTIAGYAVERGCGCILLLNKWDLVASGDKTAVQTVRDLKASAPFLHFAPVLTLSAKTGLRVQKVFDLLHSVYAQYGTRIGTGPLNKIVQKAVERNTPPMFRGRQTKIFYAAQVTEKPPTFICVTNYPEAVHPSYRRYLINQIREKTGLDQTPIRLYIRKRPRRSSPNEPKGDRERL
jgi:GTP-binding protein